MSHQFKKKKRPAKNKNNFFIQYYQKEKLAYVFNKTLATKPLLKMITTSMKKQYSTVVAKEKSNPKTEKETNK